jgi:hypothetical protein
MLEDKYRYFIELHMEGRDAIPRRCEAEVRRAQATQFVSHISQWLQQEELKDKVSSIAVTALGQVLITCEEDIISRIRDDGTLNVAAIRAGKGLSQSIQRVEGW